jgi:hypothetical protein
MRRYNCPSCGAPVIFQSAASILAVCAYCRSTLLRQDVDVDRIGTMAELKADGSVLQLHAEGRYRHVHFGIVGRIQLRYADGFWNEWHLLFDDMKTGWLSEAQGHYAVFFEAGAPAAGSLPGFDRWRLGQEVELDRRVYEVTEILRAVCVGGEGELPFVVGPGYEAPVVDLMGADTACATIDYSEDPPRVFLGAYVELDTLHLSGLKALEGWS